ncbi:MAG: RNA degradosome polyphosphate kinase, partial [Thalassolituus sp.]
MNASSNEQSGNEHNVIASHGDLSNPDYYLNRELSLLQFNLRVLEQASDENHPLMERLNFLLIFSSNMDEFFEIRVAGLKNKLETHTGQPG